MRLQSSRLPNKKLSLYWTTKIIVDIYTGKSGDVSCIYFQATGKKIELYNQNYAFPKTWEVGGTLSGRVLGTWDDYNGQWELKIDAGEIEKLSYSEPKTPKVDGTGVMVNGRRFALPVRLVKTVTE